jgi:hypothetical protein
MVIVVMVAICQIVARRARAADRVAARIGRP